MTTKITYGNVRKVMLRDLPDNDVLFDKLDELDYAVRYELSDEIDAEHQCRKMDLLIWVKNNVYFEDLQLVALIDDWWHQLWGTARLEHWEAVDTRPGLITFKSALLESLPKSTSERLGEVKVNEAWAEFAEAVETETRVKPWILDKQGELIVVEKRAEDGLVRLYGSDSEFVRPIGILKPIPRENLSQGSLRLVVVDEPIEKVGEYGVKIIITGNYSGCNALVVLSNRIADYTSETLLTQLLTTINPTWQELYERATLPKDVFDFLAQNCGFKLTNEFKDIPVFHMQKLLQFLQEETHIKQNCPTVEFDPRKDYYDKK